VIECDSCDRCNERRLDNIRRVEPSPKTHFQYRDVNTRFSETQKRRKKSGFEKRKLGPYVDSSGNDIDKRLRINALTIKSDALSKRAYMRRSEKPHAVSRLPKCFGYHGATAALAVGSCDVNHRKLLMRRTCPSACLAYGLKTEFHPTRDAKVD
jgi:hypothetical protein